MFDIGFSELVVVAIVALLVLGPERLPKAARTAGILIGRLRNSFNSIKADVERELGAQELRLQLRNEEILRKERELLEQTAQQAQQALTLEHDGATNSSEATAKPAIADTSLASQAEPTTEATASVTEQNPPENPAENAVTASASEPEKKTDKHE